MPKLDQQAEIELTGVGGAMLAAQRVEFLLYGLVAHVKDEWKQDRRFQGLTPENFLHGDLENLRVTLGQLTNAYGDRFGLPMTDLRKFVADRNLIAHNYWRLTRANIRGAERLQDPMAFLIGFLQQCSHWEKILRGLRSLMAQEIARKHGGEQKAGLTAQDREDMDYYVQQVESHVAELAREGFGTATGSQTGDC